MMVTKVECPYMAFGGTCTHCLNSYRKSSSKKRGKCPYIKNVKKCPIYKRIYGDKE